MRFTSLCCAAVLLLGSRVATAQVVTVPATATSPRGSTADPFPISQFYAYSASEIIYLRGELAQAGLLTRLAFDKQGGTTTLPLDRVVVYLKHTAATALANGPVDSTGYQRVFKGTLVNDLPDGFQDIVLQRPFAYNNVDNLAVLVVRVNGAFTRNNNVRWYYQAGQARQAMRSNADLAPLTQLTAHNDLPNARFTFGPATATQRPQAGIAVLYPVPATDYVQLPAAQPVQVLIMDGLGRVVRPGAWLRPVGGRISVPVADLPAGNYFLRQQLADGRIINQRFVRN